VRGIESVERLLFSYRRYCLFSVLERAEAPVSNRQFANGKATVHKFKIGQIVQFRPRRGLTNAVPGHYVVTRLLPERDGKLGLRRLARNASMPVTARWLRT
jgi:hypothetical protein